MKKFLVLFFLLAFVVVSAAPAFAEAGWEKLKGGAEKIVMSPKQICNNVKEEYEAADFKPFGVLGGTLKGVFYTGKEVVSGAVDIVTFPVDFEKNN